MERLYHQSFGLRCIRNILYSSPGESHFNPGQIAARERGPNCGSKHEAVHLHLASLSPSPGCISAEKKKKEKTKKKKK